MSIYTVYSLQSNQLEELRTFTLPPEVSEKWIVNQHLALTSETWPAADCTFFNEHTICHSNLDLSTHSQFLYTFKTERDYNRKVDLTSTADLLVRETDAVFSCIKAPGLNGCRLMITARCGNNAITADYRYPFEEDQHGHSKAYLCIVLSHFPEAMTADPIHDVFSEHVTIFVNYRTWGADSAYHYDTFDKPLRKLIEGAESLDKDRAWNWCPQDKTSDARLRADNQAIIREQFCLLALELLGCALRNRNEWAANRAGDATRNQN